MSCSVYQCVAATRRSTAHSWQNFSKVSSTVIVCSQFSRKLIFEKFFQHCTHLHLMTSETIEIIFEKLLSLWGGYD